MKTITIMIHADIIIGAERNELLFFRVASSSSRPAVGSHDDSAHIAADI